jgi:hypothetical protein
MTDCILAAPSLAGAGAGLGAGGLLGVAAAAVAAGGGSEGGGAVALRLVGFTGEGCKSTNKTMTSTTIYKHIFKGGCSRHAMQPKKALSIVI